MLPNQKVPGVKERSLHQCNSRSPKRGVLRIRSDTANLQNHLNVVQCAWRRSPRIDQRKAHCWATLLADVVIGLARAAGFISWTVTRVTGNVLGAGKICETGWAQHLGTPTVRQTGLPQLRFVSLPRMSCRPWLCPPSWSNWLPGSCVTCSIASGE